MTQAISCYHAFPVNPGPVMHAWLDWDRLLNMHVCLCSGSQQPTLAYDRGGSRGVHREQVHHPPLANPTIHIEAISNSCIC